MPNSTRRTITAGSFGVLAAVAVAASPAAARPDGSAPPCAPKIGTVKGHKAAINCGPATVSLSIHGKRYAFRNGLCETDGKTLFLTVGTLVLGVKGNAGLAYIDLTVLGSHTGSVSEADSGGHELVGTNLLEASGTGGKGSFHRINGVSFTGTWNCNGVVYKAP